MGKELVKVGLSAALGAVIQNKFGGKVESAVGVSTPMAQLAVHSAVTAGCAVAAYYALSLVIK